METKELHVKISFIEPLLGTAPANPEIYKDFIGSKAPDAATLAEGGSTTYVTGEVVKATCVMFATLPIIILYPFLQRYFVTGIMIGAVKG